MSMPFSSSSDRNPLFRASSILLAALSLSIGWGIRGNYGHETGAMFPGALTAIAICLLSGREDWRERVPYFACLGALGWGFGGSISYMQVIGYVQSGNLESQYYGCWGLFFIGFLWASLGGAGTALPAVLDRESLQELFKPLTLLLGLWGVLYFVRVPLTLLAQDHLAAHFLTELPAKEIKNGFELALYWFDSDWLSVIVILAGILAFDLIDRRFEKSLWLLVLAGAGGLIGYGVQLAIKAAGKSDRVYELLVRHHDGIIPHKPEDLVANWPTLFLHFSQFTGLAVGLIIGIAVYFTRFGKFRCGSSLFVHMAVGWFVSFLLFPVLLDVRMTPPRGDNWAGVLGVFVGAMIYFLRNNLQSVAAASVVAGTIGGLGFSGIAWLEAMLESFGNHNIAKVEGLDQAWTDWQQTDSLNIPEFLQNLLSDKDFLAQYKPWVHYHSANWHSFLEQSYGFVNGIAVVIALALLLRRLGPLNDEAPRRRWPEIIAIVLSLPALLYVNMIKNVNDWASDGGGSPAMQRVMKTPLMDFSLSAWGWFNLFFGFAGLAMLILMSVQSRRKLAILPSNWLGRGQLLFYVLLWSFTLGNFTKALAGFNEQRLLTEGVIIVNSVIVTLMILLLPADDGELDTPVRGSMKRLWWGAVLAMVLTAVVIPPAEAFSVRCVYGDANIGKRGQDYRFGPKATWKLKPHVKNVRDKEKK